MEAQKELNIGWYDFGARYYDPAICKFLSVDPLTEKYPGMSPYAGFANNPVRYTDPTGMEIEEGSRDEWNRQRQAVEGRRDQLQGKIDRLNAKAEAKGWSQEKLASKVGNLNERVASLNTSIATLVALH
jgi:RHS repeat-associated protein